MGEEVESFVDKDGMTHFIGHKTPAEKRKAEEKKVAEKIRRNEEDQRRKVEEDQRREAEVDLRLYEMIRREQSTITPMGDAHLIAATRALVKLPLEQLREVYMKNEWETHMIIRYFTFFTPQQQAVIRELVRESLKE